jgi:hypothetical protein
MTVSLTVTVVKPDVGAIRMPCAALLVKPRMVQSSM